MRLDEVQKWARVTFGPYSQQYLFIRAQVWVVEEWLGALVRQVEARGESLDLGLPAAYVKRLKGDPQERVQ